jgi:hydrogenase/urease accessory protein HupE
MNRLAFLALSLLATPALAHQGNHTHLDLAALAAHVFETDHIVFAAIAVLTGIFAYRAGKRAGRNERGDA